MAINQNFNDKVKNLVVVWRLTERCNAACRFCSYSNELIRPRASIEASEVLRFGRILAQYQTINRRKVLVSWLGGEPLLWPALKEVSRYYQEDCSLSQSITTNGFLLSSQRLRQLILSTYSELVISIDGLGDFHDWCRKSPGLFATLSDNLLSLREERQKLNNSITLKVNTILMAANIDRFEELCHFLVKVGVDEITFNQLGGISRPDFFKDNRLSINQVDRFSESLPTIRDKFQKFGLNIHGSENYLKRMKATAIGIKIPIEDCSPGEDFLSISENGIISPCDATSSEYGISTKEISSAADIDQIKIKFREMRQAKKSLRCGDCHCTQVFGKFDKVNTDTVVQLNAIAN